MTKQVKTQPSPSISLLVIQQWILTVALLGILPAATWLYRSATNFDGLIDQKSLHFAQVSRNMVEGRGITTSVVTPLELARMDRVDQHPELWSAPGYLFWQSFFFRLRWPSERAATMASGAAWMIMLWLVFAIARRRYGARPAWLAFFLAWANPHLMTYGLSGLPFPLAASCWLLFLDRLIPAEPSKLISAGPAKYVPWFRLLLSALLATLAVLTDYNLLGAALYCLVIYWSRWPSLSGYNKPLIYPDEINHPGDLSFTWLQQRVAPRMVLAALAVMLVASSPWWIRNWIFGGAPWYSLYHYELMTDTASYAGQSIFRLIEPSLISPAIFFLSETGQVARKVAGGLASGLSELIQQANFILLTLAVIALIRPVADEQHQRFIRYWLGASLCFVAAVAMHDADFRALAIMLPPLIVAAAGEFYGWAGTALDPALKLSRRSSNEIDLRPRIHTRSPRQLVAMLMVVLLVIQWAVVAKNEQGARMNTSANVSWLAERTPADSAVISASPWTMTWQGGITSVWMPQNQITMRRLLARHGDQLPWMYFPRQRALPPAGDPTPLMWYELIREQGRMPGFEQVSSLAAREVLYRRTADEEAE